MVRVADDLLAKLHPRIDELAELETSYPYRMAVIALVTGAILIALMRSFLFACQRLSKTLNRLMPRRVALTLSVCTVSLLVILLTNQLVVRGLLDAQIDSSCTRMN